MQGELKKNVLVVDDDELVLIRMEALLQEQGYETTTAWSGRQALELLHTADFDLVLLDDYLPDVSSEDVLKRIGRMARQPLTIVMQSSPPSLDSSRRFASLGACEVVEKWQLRSRFFDLVRALLAPAALPAAVGA